MIISHDIEIPDDCPKQCLGITHYLTLCARCPIFNCRSDEGERMIDPDDYRRDWARVWQRWFQTDMQECPVLLLEYTVTDDD